MTSTSLDDLHNQVFKGEFESAIFSFLDFDSHCNAVLVLKPSQEVRLFEKERRVSEAMALILNSAHLLTASEEPSVEDLEKALESWRCAATDLVGRCNCDHWKVNLVPLLCPAM